MGPVLGLLARAKSLRGNWLDPFAWSSDRHLDRAMLMDFEALLHRIVTQLPTQTSDHTSFCEAVAAADNIRGYGPVRHAAMERVRARWQTLFTSG